METYENIDRELEKRKMSRRKLAISIGIPPSTFQSMMERKRGITLELLKRISEFLGVSIYSLAGFDLASEAVTEEINQNRRETWLLENFRNLNSKGQAVAIERLGELVQIPAYQRLLTSPELEPGLSYDDPFNLKVPGLTAQTAPDAPDDKAPAGDSTQSAGTGDENDPE